MSAFSISLYKEPIETPLFVRHSAQNHLLNFSEQPCIGNITKCTHSHKLRLSSQTCTVMCLSVKTMAPSSRLMSCTSLVSRRRKRNIQCTESMGLHCSGSTVYCCTISPSVSHSVCVKTQWQRLFIYTYLRSRLSGRTKLIIIILNCWLSKDEAAWSQVGRREHLPTQLLHSNRW